MQLLIFSAAELTDRTCLLAFVVARLCAASPTASVAPTIVKSLLVEFNNAAASVDWRRQKTLIRFLGQLVIQKVVDNKVLTEIYTLLLAVVFDKSAKLERRETFATLILSTLPWTANALGKSEADELLASIGLYVADTVRQPGISAATDCRLFNDSAHADHLALLHKQISHCAGNEWQTDSVNFAFSHEHALSFKPVNVAHPVAITPHTATSYMLVNPHMPLLENAIKPAHVRLEYDVPHVETAEHFVSFDVVDDLIHFFESNIVEGGKYLTSRTGVLALPANESSYQIIIQVLAKNIMKLSRPELKRGYYQALIFNLCNLAKQHVPRVLGAVFYTLYAHIDKMDVEGQVIFQNWFGTHISNFDYRWSWSVWADALDLPLHAPKSLFIQGVLEMCVRLSYFERVTKALPASGTGVEIVSLMPPQPRPFYRFESAINKIDAEALTNVEAPSPELISMADMIIESIRLKQPVAEMTEKVKFISSQAVEKGLATDEASGLDVAHEIVVQAILFLGSKSFSHILNVLERQSNLLQFLNQSDEAKVKTIHIVAEFWQYNKQMMTIVLDKMVNYRIIDPTAIVTWVFAENGGVPDFDKAFVWELLNMAVSKIGTRARIISSKIKDSIEDENVKTASLQEQTDMDTDEPDHGKAVTGDDTKSHTAGSSLEKLRELAEDLQGEQQRLFILAYQSFCRAHENATLTAAQKAWCEGMMIAFGRHFHEEIKSFAVTLDMIVFQSADQKCKAIFKQATQLHA